MTQPDLQLQQRLHRETEKAHRAYMDYREMGINRSLRKLQESYIALDTPRDYPTKNLSTIEGWSSRYQWQDRITEWEQHQYDNREAEAEKERYAERIKRGALLEKLRNKIDKQMFKASLDEDSVKAFQAMTQAIKAYAELSMKHYNDLPTERKEQKTDGTINVNFITEPVPDDLVRQRLEEMGLAGMVDEQTD